MKAVSVVTVERCRRSSGQSQHHADRQGKWLSPVETQNKHKKGVNLHSPWSLKCTIHFLDIYFLHLRWTGNGHTAFVLFQWESGNHQAPTDSIGDKTALSSIDWLIRAVSFLIAHRHRYYLGSARV